MESCLVSREVDLRPYFKDLVEEAIFNQALEAAETTQFYLVNLLNSFVHTEQLFEKVETHMDEPPLAILLTRALEAGKTERIKHLRRLGDISLYIAGYFTEHIDRKIVDADYYMSMGEGAYSGLAAIFSDDDTFCNLYSELSQKFQQFVNVLGDVRKAEGVSNNSDLVRLYERWLKTGDPKLRERLIQEGIDPQNIRTGNENH